MTRYQGRDVESCLEVACYSASSICKYLWWNLELSGSGLRSARAKSTCFDGNTQQVVRINWERTSAAACSRTTALGKARMGGGFV